MEGGSGRALAGLCDVGCVPRYDRATGLGGSVHAGENDSNAATGGIGEEVDRGIDAAARDFSRVGGGKSESRNASMVSRGDCAFSFESECGRDEVRYDDR